MLINHKKDYSYSFSFNKAKSKKQIFGRCQKRTNRTTDKELDGRQFRQYQLFNDRSPKRL